MFDLNEFLAMGGHGGYVWSAYGLTFLILLITGWSAVRRYRRALNEARGISDEPMPVRRPTVTEL